mmetsp:Transcript_13180/g.30752  ORF Transcript_13180/g.30752 Transcript_13180/m.30752 type:complete len:120 (+) Transcript_13180:844-1203(+)
MQNTAHESDHEPVVCVHVVQVALLQLTTTRMVYSMEVSSAPQLLVRSLRMEKRVAGSGMDDVRTPRRKRQLWVAHRNQVRLLCCRQQPPLLRQRKEGMTPWNTVAHVQHHDQRFLILEL